MKAKRSPDRGRAAREEDIDDEFDDVVVERRIYTRRRPRFLRRLLLFLILLTGIVALAPTIVAKTPLRNLLIAAALPGDAVRVTVADASLGWFSAPALGGLEIRDAAGAPLLTVESIRLSRTPLALALNSHDLGVVEILRPTVYLAIRPDGTNLEDVLAALAKTQVAKPPTIGEESNRAATALAVKMTEGTILAQDLVTGRKWRLHALDAQFAMDAAGRVTQLSASGQMDDGLNSAAGAIPPGRFSLALNPAAGANREQIEWKAESITLAAAEPWLRRFATGTELGGTLSGEGVATWTVPPPANPQFPAAVASIVFETTGSLRVDNLDAVAPALHGDRIRLAHVELPWKIVGQQNQILIDELDLRSDLGRVAARGTIDPNALSAPGAAPDAAFDAVGRNNVQVRAEIDLARLAAMLPHTLRIRSDTTITAGTLELAARNQPVDDGQAVTGTLRTAGLAATSAGRPLKWDEPVSVMFEVRRNNGALRVESLKCVSEFLRVDASGTSQQFTANAEFDLSRLGTQLGQFVDLSGVQMAGTGTAHLDWLQSAPDQFTASANTDLSQLSVAMPGGAVWSEPRLAIKAAATGGLDPATRQPTQVASGRVQLEAESDRFDAQLTGPVNLRDDDLAWPFTLRASGSTSRWLARARPWFSPDPWQVDGQSDVAAEVRAAANNVEVSQAKLSVANLRVVGVGWSIAEPRVEIAGDLHWNGATGELASRSAQVVSSSMSLATQDVRLQSDGKSPPQLNGVAAFRADVGRVASWKVAATQPPPYQAQGMVTGNLRFAQQAGGFAGELNATGENLSLAQSSAASRGAGTDAQRGSAPVYQAIWQEPRVAIQGKTHYDASVDRLAFEQVQVQSNTLQAALQGQIDRLSTTADTNAAGTLTYDLAQITSLLRPYTGGGVQLVGREKGRFQVAGSFANPAAHWSRTVQGRFEAPWTSADVYGLPVGAGRVAGTLGEGLVRFDPLALAVAEGRLTASPLVRLDPEPMEFTMPAGPLLTDVRISPQVSEAMLKYIAPVLAGATQSEGHFSLDLDGARVPLGDPKRADMAGKLAVHAVRVVPGPMAKQWVELAQQIEAIAKRRDLAAAGQSEPISLLTIQDQQVNFRVVDGRVYHQNMQFQVGDVTLRSEGSVGLDETLALVLHVPIQDKWIEGQAFLVGLRGQSLAIPVKGTLRQPQLDRGAVAGLSQQLLQGAAQQAIGGELNKAFDKLFKPRQ